MKKFMNWFTKEESGQGMVEYGLIIALVSIVVIAILTTVGTNLKAIFQKIATALTVK
ncbi:MAG: Flp family type IVb pilin [Peptoniphilaceae bacterium]|uniref:Flp family type IVb pilin n=1 Tax=Parvimonas sp. TaxID=1944660 RepID=UPI0025EE088C|nr:Flp family type IVb pilin [Parvimonas sp.]MCI5997605.1 Flp family type IVb pilin [Parvimonas sp.]MDD7765200.1 Flp family type IVb pilin [Peptoniphilaceae bacterium]